MGWSQLGNQEITLDGPSWPNLGHRRFPGHAEELDIFVELLQKYANNPEILSLNYFGTPEGSTDDYYDV